MSQPCVFRCSICHNPIGKPYISLDRRTERTGTKTVHTLLSQEMFRYDSQDCRLSQEPPIVAQLQLKTTYPANDPITPCNRCGAPVERALPHISYAYMEVDLDVERMVATVIDDTELAVLCRDCEEPDEPAAEATTESTDQKERTTA